MIATSERRPTGTRQIAAECTSKRLHPDYISAKVMRAQEGERVHLHGMQITLTVEESQKNADGSHVLRKIQPG